MDKQEQARSFDYKEPLRDFSFPENLCFRESNALYSTFEAIAVKVVEMHDEMLVKACVDAAKEAGLCHLTLVDKQFVVDAIREKMDGGLETVKRQRDTALAQLNCKCWACKNGKPVRRGSSSILCERFGGLRMNISAGCPGWEWNEGKEHEHEQ